MRRPLALALLLAGCPTGPAVETPLPAENPAADIVAIDLSIDVDARTGRATVRFAEEPTGTASLDVSGLDLQDVSFDIQDVGFLHEENDGRLDMGFTPGLAASVTIDYAFETAEGFDGLLESGSTILWPYWCGNLYPCDPDPNDDFTLTMAVTSEADAVHPEGPIGGMPAYQPALATGEFNHTVLGTSAGGVELNLWTTEAAAASGAEGTADLVALFSWMEDTLGPYPFGDRAGVVSVDWGFGAYGGLENHPFWHVSEIAMGDALVHAHEAAHGWFGGGIRLACWEDFVLSEGLATYLAARATEVVVGPEAGADAWEGYEGELSGLLQTDDRVVLPDSSCGEIDVLEALWSRIVYMKGAFFLRDVATAVGAAELDGALGAFARARVGSAARMQDLLDTIQAETGFDPGPLAEEWLRTEGAPAR